MYSLLLFLVRLLLSGVFLIAGVSKLFGGFANSRKTLVSFGVPSFFVDPLSIALPFIEVCTGFLLLFNRSAQLGAIAAVALLLVFDAVIAVNLALGKNPPCNCFGQLHSKPIGWDTFARNGILAIIAGGVVWYQRVYPNESMWPLFHSLSGTQIGLMALAIAVAVAVSVQAILLLQMFRQNGRLLLRIEALEANRMIAPQPVAVQPVPRGLPIGSQAPRFELPDLQGGTRSLEGFLTQGKPALLLFTSPGCGPCNALMPDVATWQKTLAVDFNLILISDGAHDLNRAKVAEYGLINVLVEKKRKVAEKYNALGTPTAVIVRENGTIGSHPIGGADAIRNLVTHKAWTDAGFAGLVRVLTQPQAPPPAKPTIPLGSPAPAFALPDLKGNIVQSSAFNGNGTVLLFWSPGCGFCQKMIPDLKQWEQTVSSTAPRLVLVSSGSRESNAEMDLKSPVVLEENFAVGRLYGASGTPSALMIDSNGKIASELTVGAPAVLDLLGWRQPSPR
jgi:thiol-disulfide isomerase/thioredoxin/uncharacterized membrane protein YphA (DoxX/SURF4 family)